MYLEHHTPPFFHIHFNLLQDCQVSALGDTAVQTMLWLKNISDVPL